MRIFQNQEILGPGQHFYHLIKSESSKEVKIATISFLVIWPSPPFQLLEYQWGEGRFDTLGLLGSAHRAQGQHP